VRERAQLHGWAPLEQHWKKCLPEGILASAVMQPLLSRTCAAGRRPMMLLPWLRPWRLPWRPPLRLRPLGGGAALF
jgi:hypothetical protein